MIVFLNTTPLYSLSDFPSVTYFLLSLYNFGISILGPLIIVGVMMDLVVRRDRELGHFDVEFGICLPFSKCRK